MPDFLTFCTIQVKSYMIIQLESISKANITSFHINNDELSKHTLVSIPPWLLWHFKHLDFSLFNTKWLNSGPMKTGHSSLKMETASSSKCQQASSPEYTVIAKEWKQARTTNWHEWVKITFQKFFLNASDNIKLRSTEMQFRHNECMCFHYALFQYLFLATVFDVLACCWHLHKLHMVVCI